LNGPGWMPQPLHDAKNSISRIAGMLFFISSPPCQLYPASLKKRGKVSRCDQRAFPISFINA
jgi:hypothetical protein